MEIEMEKEKNIITMVNYCISRYPDFGQNPTLSEGFYLIFSKNNFFQKSKIICWKKKLIL